MGTSIHDLGPQVAVRKKNVFFAQLIQRNTMHLAYAEDPPQLLFLCTDIPPLLRCTLDDDVIIHTSEEINQPYLALSTNGRLVWLAADDLVLHDVIVALALRYIVSDVAAAETVQFWRDVLPPDFPRCTIITWDGASLVCCRCHSNRLPEKVELSPRHAYLLR
jgi:hypothetical protein